MNKYSLLSILCFSLVFVSVQSFAARNNSLTLSERVAKLEQNGGNSTLMVDLLTRIEQLQIEMQQLRGLVEEQANTITQLQQRQRDQYLDIDRRIEQIAAGNRASPVLGSHVVPGGNNVATNYKDPTITQTIQDMPTVRQGANNQSVTNRLTDKQTFVSAPIVDPEAERKLYNDAFQKLKNGQYADAAQAFQQFLNQFPTGEFSDNAQYWLGESYYVTKNYEIALEAFEKLINNFPNSKKIPDAELKLGFTFYELKQWDRSRFYLTQVTEKYPNTTVARLAAGRLKAIRIEGN